MFLNKSPDSFWNLYSEVCTSRIWKPIFLKSIIICTKKSWGKIYTKDVTQGAAVLTNKILSTLGFFASAIKRYRNRLVFGDGEEVDLHVHVPQDKYFSCSELSYVFLQINVDVSFAALKFVLYWILVCSHDIWYTKVTN